MTITVEMDFGKKEIHSFEDLVSSAYELAMGFGREIVSRALETRDQELMQARDKRRYRSKLDFLIANSAYKLLVYDRGLRKEKRGEALSLHRADFVFTSCFR